jgi:putative radical SAM enzyme (TIGR03279 family)
MKGIISAVRRNTIAEAFGIMPGEKLIAVNGTSPADIIELSYLVADEIIDLSIESQDGELRHVIIEKQPDEDLGLEFESAVFDGVRYCHNKCVFCFVDQMIPGMRNTLYDRDDDFRLSFLYGNFLTLTNMKECDYERIIKTHMSPLYVSIHATDSEVRRNMMNNKNAGNILDDLQRLIDNGITIHTQVVLCPGFNDGEILEKTFKDLVALAPMVETMAVVPVGLTKNRENLPEVRLFTSVEAQNIISQVEKWQDECREKFGNSFIYLGDEFYINAGMNLPDAERYDGFPQLENGIGLSRNFLDEWENAIAAPNGSDKIENALVPVGESAYKLLKQLVDDYNNEYKTCHKLVAVTNHFFGKTINVTGLLTGMDILNALSDFTEFNRIILPQVVLNKDLLFLDDMSLADFKKLYKGKVECAKNAKELKQLLAKQGG